MLTTDGMTGVYRTGIPSGTAYDVVVTDDDPESVEIEFNTAWSPPEAICSAIREQYPDVSSRGSTTSPAVR